MESKPISMDSVVSSNIDAVGFDQGPPAILQIRFRGGGVYQYRGEDQVVEDHYKALMAAESKGKHFTAHIRRDKRLTVTRVDKE